MLPEPVIKQTNIAIKTNRIKYLERKVLLQGNYSLLTLCKKVIKTIISHVRELKRQTILPLKPEYVLSSKFTPASGG